jgi:hypothetical protein
MTQSRSNLRLPVILLNRREIKLGKDLYAVNPDGKSVMEVRS